MLLKLGIKPSAQASRNPASLLRCKPTVGLAAKVLAPVMILTLLAAVLGGLILTVEYRSYQESIAQNKAELGRHVRALYTGNRSKLLDVAKLIADNPSVQNGMLIGDQYNPLNTIMSFVGHSGIDMINLYDLDGRAFARAQSPSYFGDYDEFSPVVRTVGAASTDQASDVMVGIASYRGKATLVVVRVTKGVSGPTGVVVVGQTVSAPFLQTFTPTNHTTIELRKNGAKSNDAKAEATPGADDRIAVYEERSVSGGAGYQVALVTDDPALFSPFWQGRASILAIAAIAAGSSMIVTSIFVFMTVVRPVRHLISVAEQQVSGNLSARVSLRSRDELGRLGDILNLLTSNLKNTLEGQDRVNEQLEDRVEQRTTELQRELVARERAQAALTRAKEEAEAANVSKSRFLAAASHDLRQPVHAMTLFVSNLAQQVETPKARKSVANINACVETLCEMFENILDVSKLAAGVIQPQIEEFPIGRLLGRLQREFEDIAQEKGIELRSVRSTLMLKSDPTLLYRILSNLVSNALKNTKEGRVLIGCRRRSHTAEIQILDTGVGIPESEIGHVFREFYRGANKTESKGGVGFGAGLGLGLSIVEHTANLLDHNVYVSSAPGKGTRFSITLPSVPAAIRSNPSSGDMRPDVSGTRVLVVEDDILPLRAVQSTLENWGCHVEAVQTSGDALAHLARNERPQVLIVDYLLQSSDTGLSLLRKVEQDLGLCIPAIVLSGVSSRLLEREVELCGAQLLYKPTHPAQLRRAIAHSISFQADCTAEADLS